MFDDESLDNATTNEFVLKLPNVFKTVSLLVGHGTGTHQSAANTTQDTGRREGRTANGTNTTQDTRKEHTQKPNFKENQNTYITETI